MSNKPATVTRAALTLTFLLFIALSCKWTTPPTQTNTSTPSPTALPSPTVELPKIGAPVNDLAGLLDEAAEKRIADRLAVLKKNRQVEMAVLTVPTTGSQNIFDYSLAVARTWTTQTDQRILLVLAITDKKWRIQVTNNLESVLTNDVLKKLGEASESNYKHAEYEAGILRLISGVEAKLTFRPKTGTG